MYFYRNNNSRDVQEFAKVGFERNNLFVSVFTVIQNTFYYLDELNKFQEFHDDYCIKNNYDKKYN